MFYDDTSFSIQSVGAIGGNSSGSRKDDAL